MKSKWMTASEAETVVKWESSDSAVARVEGVGLVFNGKETGATADRHGGWRRHRYDYGEVGWT